MSSVPLTTFPAMLAILLLASACNLSSPPLAPANRVDVPSQFKDQQVEWKRIPINKTVEQQLSKYLEQHPEFQEHPGLQSEPVVFQSARNKIRVYWLPPFAEQPMWVLYSNEDRESITDGAGDPFASSRSTSEDTK